ncbi:unnamed protein product, partial [Polarella glacialis]
PCNVTPSALVQHLFLGAWKPRQEEERHWWEEWDSDTSGRRRRSLGPGDFLDWRMPALALMAHLHEAGMHLPWEAVRLLFSRLVPIEPPLLPAPPPFRAGCG